MTYRFNPLETEVQYGSFVFKHPTFKHCYGQLTRVQHPKYKYLLKWNTKDNSAYGQSEYQTAESLFAGLMEYSFDNLEIDSDLVVELYAAGFQGEFIVTLNRAAYRMFMS